MLKNAIHFYSALLLSLVLMGTSVSTHAQDVSFPPKPTTENYFSDVAGLINPEDAIEINRLGDALLSEEQVALYVVTIASLANYDAAKFSIENYARRLFDHWGIGFDDRNYGMLLLISKGDRRARIELGADWGNDYDQDAQRVMDDLIIPEFKRENFSSGIAHGVRGMDAMARGLNLPAPIRPWWLIPLIIAGFVLTIGVIISLFKSGRRGWGWALLAGLAVLTGMILTHMWNNRGSAGGFGGGSSGGGGASGSW